MLTKILIGIILSLGMTGLISFFGARETIIAALKSMNMGFFLLACCSYIFLVFVDALRTKLLLSLNGEKVSYRLCLQNTILGLYTSAITPFSAGGQPFQIYHLVKNGVLIERSSMAVGVKFITSLSVMISGSFLLLIFAGKRIISDAGSAFLVYTGLVLTCSAYLFFLLLIFSKTFTYKIFTSKLLTRILSRITRRNTEVVFKKTVDSLTNYFDLLKSLWNRSKPVLLLNIILTASEILISVSIPYVLMVGFGIRSNYFEFLCAILVMTMVVYFLPTPGSSGGVEGAFYMMFRNMFSKEVVVATVITWRLITYYAIIVAGSLILPKVFLDIKQTKQS